MVMHPDRRAKLNAADRRRRIREREAEEAGRCIASTYSHTRCTGKTWHGDEFCPRHGGKPKKTTNTQEES